MVMSEVLAANNLAYLYAEKLGPESKLQPLNVHLKTTVGVNRLPWPQYHAKPRIFVPDAWVALHAVFP